MLHWLSQQTVIILGPLSLGILWLTLENRVISISVEVMGHFVRHFMSLTNIIRIIRTGPYEACKPKLCNDTESLCQLSVCFLQCPYAPRFQTLQFWSRSSFWVTVRAARFLNDADVGKTLNRSACTAENSPITLLSGIITDCSQCHLLQILVSFARSNPFEWFWYLWPKMAFNVPGISNRLPDITTEIWSLKMFSVLFLLTSQ